MNFYNVMIIIGLVTNLIGILTILRGCKQMAPLGKSGAFVAKEFIKRLDEDIDKYNFLAENVPCIVWTTSADGKANYYNHRWYEYTGLSFEDSIGGGWIKAVHPEDLSRTKEAWLESLKCKKPFEVCIRLLRNSDKTYRYHLARCVPRINLRGEVSQWIGSSIDIDST